MNISQCKCYLYILCYTLIVVFIYKNLNFYKIKFVENFNIVNRNPLEIIGKYCDLNVLNIMRNHCHPNIFNYFKNQYQLPINYYYNNNYDNNYDEMFVKRYGDLYSKKENAKYKLLPLFGRKQKGGFYEYHTVIVDNHIKFEIPIYKNQKINSIKSREIYDSDEIVISEPINDVYTAKIY